MPAWARWAALAVLGILVAAAVSVAASRLTSQKIGLASEPLSAGEGLAPTKESEAAAPANHEHGAKHPGQHPSHVPPATTTAATTTAATPTATTTTAAPSAPVAAPGSDGEADGGADD